MPPCPACVFIAMVNALQAGTLNPGDSPLKWVLLLLSLSPGNTSLTLLHMSISRVGRGADIQGCYLSHSFEEGAKAQIKDSGI